MNKAFLTQETQKHYMELKDFIHLFSQEASPENVVLRDYIENVASKPRGTTSILDYFCGPGHSTLALTPRHLVHHYDLQNYFGLGESFISQLDRNMSYDVIVMKEALPHLFDRDDLVDTLTTLKNHLNHGGSLLFLDGLLSYEMGTRPKHFSPTGLKSGDQELAIKRSWADESKGICKVDLKFQGPRGDVIINPGYFKFWSIAEFLEILGTCGLVLKQTLDVQSKTAVKNLALNTPYLMEIAHRL